MDAVLYVHGKGGNAAEAEHYKSLFPSCYVTGIEYKGFTPWEAGAEIKEAVISLKKRYEKVILIANSIGAFFSMNADICEDIAFAYFISPILDMEKLICGMMKAARVTEEELREKGTIPTPSLEELSWEYLRYVKGRPVKWSVPTEILFGSEDKLTSIDTVRQFAVTHGAGLSVMQGGEHWFHTREQMGFLDDQIKESERDRRK